MGKEIEQKQSFVTTDDEIGKIRAYLLTDGLEI